MKTEPRGQTWWFIPVIPALSRHRLGDYRSRLALVIYISGQLGVQNDIVSKKENK